ncbi:MAG: hypothetical protein U0166_19360 [Acidobacteriota bacterium]
MDERSDVYSLGAVLFEIYGRPAPYAGVDSAVILYRVVARPSPIREIPAAATSMTTSPGSA